MRCPWSSCREPRKGMRYGADGVEVCLGCGELSRDGSRVTLDDFLHLSPEVQRLIGNERVLVQHVRGEFNDLIADGCILDRSV